MVAERQPKKQIEPDLAPLPSSEGGIGKGGKTAIGTFDQGGSGDGGSKPTNFENEDPDKRALRLARQFARIWTTQLPVPNIIPENPEYQEYLENSPLVAQEYVSLKTQEAGNLAVDLISKQRSDLRDVLATAPITQEAKEFLSYAQRLAQEAKISPGAIITLEELEISPEIGIFGFYNPQSIPKDYAFYEEMLLEKLSAWIKGENTPAHFDKARGEEIREGWEKACIERYPDQLLRVRLQMERKYRSK